MKKVEDLNVELIEVGKKNKVDIIAFAQMLINEYGALLVLDVNSELVKANDELAELTGRFNAVVNEKILLNDNLTDLNLRFDAVLVEKDELAGELEVAKTLAEEAISQANTSSISPLKARTVTVAGRSAKINFGVNFNGTDYTADELLNNPEVVAELFKIGSGAITLDKEEE